MVLRIVVVFVDLAAEAAKYILDRLAIEAQVPGAEAEEKTPIFDSVRHEQIELLADQRTNLYGDSDFDEWVLENGWIS